MGEKSYLDRMLEDPAWKDVYIREGFKVEVEELQRTVATITKERDEARATLARTDWALRARIDGKHLDEHNMAILKARVQELEQLNDASVFDCCEDAKIRLCADRDRYRTELEKIVKAKDYPWRDLCDAVASAEKTLG